MPTFVEYKSRIAKTDDYPAVITEARAEHGVSVSQTPLVYVGRDIPFNLEREFFDALLDEDRLSEAERILERMRLSYINAEAENILEQFAYRLRLIQKTEKLIQGRLNRARRDFDQHTILIISIVVGVITIFGTANQILQVRDLSEALLTFKTISLAVTFFVAVAFVVNSFTK